MAEETAQVMFCKCCKATALTGVPTAQRHMDSCAVGCYLARSTL